MGRAVIVKIMLLVRLDVGVDDIYVIISVRALLFVHLSYGVHELVHNCSCLKSIQNSGIKCNHNKFAKRSTLIEPSIY